MTNTIIIQSDNRNLLLLRRSNFDHVRSYALESEVMAFAFLASMHIRRTCAFEIAFERFESRL